MDQVKGGLPVVYLKICTFCLFLMFCDCFMYHSEKGKASFSESDGVTILMKVVQESDDEEFVDLVFEIFLSVIIDGKLFVINKLNVNFRFHKGCEKSVFYTFGTLACEKVHLWV